MYKAFIVEDNPWERKEIQQIIDWNSMDIDIVGIYANGEEAIEKIEELKPHIVFTDVVMPRMNGIELADYLYRKHPEIKLVFFSAYDEFEYAKSAIALNVHGYVLKPILPEELMEVVDKVLSACKKQDELREKIETMAKQIDKSLPILKEQFMKQLLYNKASSDEDVAEKLNFLQMQIPENIYIQLICIKIEESYIEDESQESYDDFLAAYKAKNILDAMNNDHSSIFTIQVSNKELVVIMFHEKGVDSKELVVDTAVKIYEAINDRLNLNTTIGISNSSPDLYDIPELYRQSLSAAEVQFYGQNNPIILYDDIKDIHVCSSEESVKIEELYREIGALIKNGNKEDISKFVDKYYCGRRALKTGDYVKSLTFSIINLAHIMLLETGKPTTDIFDDETALWKRICRLQNVEDLKQWVYNMLVTLYESFNLNTSMRNRRIVEDIKEIIHNRYNEQLTLTDISESVFFSPKHINNIFKEETGKTIFEYIIEYRIEKAKELLKDPYLKVYTVANEVGYTNSGHFSLLFKKITGMTPTQYRERF